jgi:hypothetical protein
MEIAQWMDLLGNDSVGDAVYVMLLGMRSQEGAVPKTMIITHGNEDESRNGLGNGDSGWGRVE